MNGLPDRRLLHVTEGLVELLDLLLAAHLPGQERDDVRFLARCIGIQDLGEGAEGIQRALLESLLDGQDLWRVSPRHRR